MDKRQVDIARALTDKDYFEGLSEEERAQVPQNPAGEVEVTDDDLAAVSGGELISPVEGDGGGTGTGSSTGTNCPCNCHC